MAIKANSIVVDIPYVTGRHWRVADLCELDRLRYLALWALGAELGRELLPEVYNLTNPARLMQAIGVGRGRSVQASCKGLVTKGLILTPIITSKTPQSSIDRVTVDADVTVPMRDLCRIVIVGLADRYPKRHIQRYDKSPPVRFGSVRFGSNGLASGDSAGKSQRSASQNANDELLLAVNNQWHSRYPEIDLSIALAQRIVTYCKRLNRCPAAVVDAIAQRANSNPRAYAIRFCRTGQLPGELEHGPKLYPTNPDRQRGQQPAAMNEVLSPIVSRLSPSG